MAAMELTSNIQSALLCISSPSPPGTIQQAQDALLRWEETATDQYVVGLLSIVGLASACAQERASTATLRLAAVLALKAAAARRWKDRGRGKLGAQKKLLSEDVKTMTRHSLLNLVTCGRIQQQSDQPNLFITNPDEITSQQLELMSDKPLQTNVASLLAKIARLDLPLKFHDLIPTLVEGIARARGVARQLEQRQDSHQMQCAFEAILFNTTNSLHNVLSEISTQRLLVDKKYRNSISSSYLGSIVENGLLPALQKLNSLSGSSDVNGEEMASLVRYATLVSRAVSHMMISSFTKLVEDAALTALVDRTMELVHSFLSQWLPCTMLFGTNTREPLKDLLHVHCELIVHLQKDHPMAFVRYLNPFLELFHHSLIRTVEHSNGANQSGADAAASGAQLPKQFVVVFLNLLTNVVGTLKYAESDAAHNELKRFFGASLVQPLSRILLQLFSIHMLPSNSYGNEEEDAETVHWQDDPEAFYHWETKRLSDGDLECAAQNLYLALVESNMDFALLPSLVDLLKNVPSQRLAVELEAGSCVGVLDQDVSSSLPLGPPVVKYLQELNATSLLILQWDAIFTAAGLTSSSVENYPGFDFHSWFESSLGHCLVHLLKSGESHQPRQIPLLQRRMIWLLSCNIHQINLMSPLNPLGLFSSSLSPQNDICVRLTALQALDGSLPQCEDAPSVLHSIVEPSVLALYQLANDCAEIESQSMCLDFLANLIAYVGATGGSISNSLLNTIVSPLSSLWKNADDQNRLLRRSVLGILSCIASYVGPENCSVLYPLALPLVDDSFTNAENMFLVEEALKIWWTFMRLSTSYDPLLGKMFIHAAELSKDLDHVMILMRITEHNIIVGGSAFLNEHYITLQTVLSNIVGEVRPLGTAYVFLVIEALLRSFPVEGGGSLLQSCGVLKLFVDACAGNFNEDDKCEPDRCIVLYLTALARISLSNPSALNELLPMKLPSGKFFREEDLVSLYVRKFQVAGNGAHGLLFQKVWVLFLLSLYPPCQPAAYNSIVLKKSDEIFTNVVYVIKNVHADGSNILPYDVEYGDEEETVNIGANMYEALLHKKRTQDVCIAASIHEVASAKMKGLLNELGDKYQSFLGTINNETLQQCHYYGIVN